MKLSEGRAKAVMDYLVAHGIDATRLTSKGWGETKPLAKNDTDEGKEQNRRVEFLITEQDEVKKTVLEIDPKTGKEIAVEDKKRKAKKHKKEAAKKRQSRAREREGNERGEGAMSKTMLTLVLLGAAVSGCSFHARDADSYRKETRALLETKNAEIKNCYDTELVKNPKLSGTVVVKFTVEKETGKICGRQAQQEGDAPEGLGQCVIKAIAGLALDPPDEREGDATFSWEFAVK